MFDAACTGKRSQWLAIIWELLEMQFLLHCLRKPLADDLVLPGCVLEHYVTVRVGGCVCRDAAADWGLQCMRYEIRDISPPTGVRAAMELQVRPIFV